MSGSSISQVAKFAPMAVATNSLAAGVTGAGPWTTFTQPTDGLGHNITIKNNTANSHTGQTLTITGTDPDGNAQTESGITGPAGSATVTSTKYFKTVSQISVSATIGADTFDIGAAATLKSQSYKLNPVGAFGAAFFAEQSGTSTWSLELCAVDPSTRATQDTAPWVAAPAGLTTQSATGTGVVGAAAGYAAWRFKQASQTGTPTVTVSASQP